MNKDQTVTVLQRLHSNKQAAANFVRDPAAEWQALGGQLPPGVTPAQFSQRVRGGELFKAIQATANGQMSAMAWGPCTMFVLFVFDALGITAAVAATIATEGGDVAIATALARVLGYELTVVKGAFATGLQAGLAGIAAIICRGH